VTQKGLQYRKRRIFIILCFVAGLLVPQQASKASSDGISHVHNNTTREIKLLSFNVWVSGTNVKTGQNKVLNAILMSGADVVGLAEADEAFGNTIAEKLGWFKYVTPDNVIISRFPVHKGWNSIRGAGAEIILDNNKTIAVKTVHLTAYPYGPYRACLDEADYTDIYVDEETTSNRVPEIAEALSTIDAYIKAGVPTFLLGDLNSPSHQDWIEETVESHCFYAVEWPVTVKIEQAGLIDTYRQMHPNPVTDPGNTWSPIYHNWFYGSGKPEPMDRIDFIFYSGNNVLLLDADLFVIGTPEQYPLHLQNDWPSDHAAVTATVAVETGAEVRPLPIAKFYAGSAAVVEGESVQFTDISTNMPTQWEWKFDGGVPETSTEQHPVVVYNRQGEYTVTLKVSNAEGGDILQVNGLVNVQQEVSGVHLELNKRVYAIDETIIATFENGPGNAKDWVGIYKEGDTPNAVWSTLWFYVNGSQSAGEAISDGTVTFLGGLPNAGSWWAGFFENDGYALLDSVRFKVGEPSGVQNDQINAPESWALSNYPNPFNAETRITFALPQDENVTLQVYDVRGVCIATLAQQRMTRGEHAFQFNGNSIPSGCYFCRLQYGDHSVMRKMLLIR